jgi:hypothetical protein
VSRRSTLSAALGLAQRPRRAPELQLLHRYLDTWTGVGDIVVGRFRQGWDLQLTGYGNDHWWATFWSTGESHSIPGGSAWEPAPWMAMQKAAWAALRERQ